MTEQERIESIRRNGGLHLKNFNDENKTYAMCLVAVQKDGEALSFVPIKYRTEELYTAACKQNGIVLGMVPEEQRSLQLCEYAVASCGQALQYVPSEYRSKDLCFKAVTKASQVYNFVPLEYITPDFVIDVVHASSNESISNLPNCLKNNDFYYELIAREPSLIWNVPQKALTAKICKAAIKAFGYNSLAEAIKAEPRLLGRMHFSLYDHDTCLAFVTSEYFAQGTVHDKYHINYYGFNTDKDEEKGRLYIHQQFNDAYSLPAMMKWPDVIMPLLKLNGTYITFVDSNLITEEMCKAAITSNYYAFERLPEQFKTQEMCQFAFSVEPYVLREMPEQCITEEMALQAVTHSGYILKYVPEKYRTKEVCLVAVSDKGNGDLEWVPRDVLDKDICLAWLKNVEHAYRSLEKIPVDLWDYDVCLAAVTVDGSELEKVPAEYLNNEICLAAAKSSSWAAQYIPKDLFTQEMAKVITDRTSSGFEYIPASALTEEMCINVIKQGSWYGGTKLRYVPKELITQKMCDIAMEVSLHSLQYVPEQFVTKEMLVRVAIMASGLLKDNFPERFRNAEIINEMIKEAPEAESYLNAFLK